MKEKQQTKNENNVKMQNTAKNSELFAILKYAFATLFACVVAVFYFFAVSFCLFPKTAISASEKMNWKGGEVLGYEQIYKKSGKIEDLYNLTLATIKANRHGQTISCIQKLQEDVDYEAFCEKLDNSAKQSVKKEYVAYVANLDSYLQNQKVVALYKNGKKTKAEATAIADLERQNRYTFALDAYVSCFASAKNEKQLLASLADEEYKSKTILQLIDDKIALLEYSSLNEIEQIMSVYTLLKINKVKYAMQSAKGLDADAENTKQEITRLQSEYATLVA